MLLGSEGEPWGDGWVMRHPRRVTWWEKCNLMDRQTDRHLVKRLDAPSYTPLRCTMLVIFRMSVH